VFLRAIGASVDPGPILSGYLGTALIGGAAMAFGLFASAVTRNQIVAATLSFVGFFLVLLAGAVEGQIDDPRLGAIVHRLSLFRMMEDFGHGIVDSRNVVLLLTATLLGVLAALGAVRALRGGGGSRGTLPTLRRVIVPLAVLAVAIAGNYAAGRRYVRGDWTRSGLYGLSDKTIGVLRALPRRVDAYVFLYRKRDSEQARALTGMVRELVDRFTRYAPDRFHVEIIDPERSPARAEAMQKKYGLGAYEVGDGVVIFTSGTQSKFLTREDLVDYDPEGYGADGGGGAGRLRAWKGEAAFVSALLTVTSDDQPTVCFVKGHGEPDIESFEDGGYATFAEDLARDAYRTRSLDRLAPAPIPPACRVLVIAEPQQAYSDAEVAALDRYLEGGGRLLLMMGPVFNHDASGFARVGLEDLARRWGAELGDNLVVDPEHASDAEGPSVWSTSAESVRPDDPILSRLGNRVTVWPRARQVKAVGGARALLSTGGKGWAETDVGTIRGDTDLTFDKAKDVEGPVSVAVAAERHGSPANRGATTRVAVFGTGRLVMNYRLNGLLVRDYDRDLVLSTIAWLADRPERAGIAPKVPEQVRLTLQAGTIASAFRLFVVALPLGCLALGALVWFRRRV
jgi:ABC-2 type transport system permease protein